MGNKPFMSRRGFFQRLFGAEGRVETTFFALQLALEVGAGSDLRDRLHGVIDAPVTGAETPADKRRFYKRLTSIVHEAEPYYELGFFQYETDAEAAREAFGTWVREIEASVATEDDEVGEDVDGYHRLSSESTYVVVSMLFLMHAKHPLHGAETDEDELYSRPGMGKLVDSVNRLDFEALEADAAFVIPGSAQDGLSHMDLMDEGWGYLKMLKSDMVA